MINAAPCGKVPIRPRLGGSVWASYPSLLQSQMWRSREPARNPGALLKYVPPSLIFLHRRSVITLTTPGDSLALAPRICRAGSERTSRRAPSRSRTPANLGKSLTERPISPGGNWGRHCRPGECCDCSRTGRARCTRGARAARGRLPQCGLCSLQGSYPCGSRQRGAVTRWVRQSDDTHAPHPRRVGGCR